MWYVENINKDIPIKNVMLNFLPSWWHKNHGIQYGKAMVFDPDYRTEIYSRMKRIMFERFGDLEIGEATPQPAFTFPDFGNAVTPALAGGTVEYPEDGYPAAASLSAERLCSLEIAEDLYKVFPYNELVKQADYLNNKLGKHVKPLLPVRGVLNEAVLLRGADLYADLYDEEDSCGKYVLDYSCNLMKTQIEKNLSQGYGSVMAINCTVAMLSPKQYEEKVFPYDMQVFERCERMGVSFMLHHCGKFDEYIPVYRKFRKVDFIEIGTASDAKKALDAFPEATIQYIVDCMMMYQGTATDIRSKLEDIMDKTWGNWHRLQLNICDLEYGTPDDNVREVFRSLKRYIRDA